MHQSSASASCPQPRHLHCPPTRFGSAVPLEGPRARPPDRERPPPRAAGQRRDRHITRRATARRRRSAPCGGRSSRSMASSGDAATAESTPSGAGGGGGSGPKGTAAATAPIALAARRRARKRVGRHGVAYEYQHRFYFIFLFCRYSHKYEGLISVEEHVCNRPANQPHGPCTMASVPRPKPGMCQAENASSAKSGVVDCKAGLRRHLERAALQVRAAAPALPAAFARESRCSALARAWRARAACRVLGRSNGGSERMRKAKGALLRQLWDPAAHFRAWGCSISRPIEVLAGWHCCRPELQALRVCTGRCQGETKSCNGDVAHDVLSRARPFRVGLWFRLVECVSPRGPSATLVGPRL